MSNAIAEDSPCHSKWRTRIERWLFESRRFRLGLLVAAFVALMWNGRQFTAGNGYDFGAHRDYAEFLYANGRLPTLENCTTAVYPPLFYVFGASMIWTQEHIVNIRHYRLAKIVLALMAFAVILVSSRIAGWILGDEARTPYLLFLLATPSFFRGAAMYIPQPFMAFWVWMAAYAAIRSWKQTECVSPAAAALCGALLGAAVWTRPEALAAVGAFGLAFLFFFLRDAPRRRRWLLSGAILTLVCSVGVLSYFAYNQKRFGHFLNVYDARGKLKIDSAIPFYKRQPLSFHFDPQLKTLFSNPLRPALGNHWPPILYDDYWGDYWRYWSANHEEEISEPFWRAMLSIQNALALVPSLMMLLGGVALLAAAVRAPARAAPAPYVLFALLIGVGMLFYWVFITGTPHPDYDQIKVSYITFLIPALPLGGAWALRAALRRENSRAWLLAPYCLAFWLWSFACFCVYPHNF